MCAKLDFLSRVGPMLDTLRRRHKPTISLAFNHYLAVSMLCDSADTCENPIQAFLERKS